MCNWHYWVCASVSQVDYWLMINNDPVIVAAVQQKLHFIKKNTKNDQNKSEI